MLQYYIVLDNPDTCTSRVKTWAQAVAAWNPTVTKAALLVRWQASVLAALRFDRLVEEAVCTQLARQAYLRGRRSKLLDAVRRAFDLSEQVMLDDLLSRKPEEVDVGTLKVVLNPRLIDFEPLLQLLGPHRGGTLIQVIREAPDLCVHSQLTAPMTPLGALVRIRLASSRYVGEHRILLAALARQKLPRLAKAPPVVTTLPDINAHRYLVIHSIRDYQQFCPQSTWWQFWIGWLNHSRQDVVNMFWQTVNPTGENLGKFLLGGY